MFITEKGSQQNIYTEDSDKSLKKGREMVQELNNTGNGQQELNNTALNIFRSKIFRWKHYDVVNRLGKWNEQNELKVFTRWPLVITGSLV